MQRDIQLSPSSLVRRACHTTGWCLCVCLAAVAGAGAVAVVDFLSSRLLLTGVVLVTAFLLLSLWICAITSIAKGGGLGWVVGLRRSVWVGVCLYGGHRSMCLFLICSLAWCVSVTHSHWRFGSVDW